MNEPATLVTTSADAERAGDGWRLATIHVSVIAGTPGGPGPS